MRKIDTRLFFMRYLLSTQAGFSLLEALMAVVVVSILLTAILPMIILSTATRVQARRIDLATKAARSYIDGVRSGAIDIISAPTTSTNCPSPPATFPFIDSTQTSQSQYFKDTAIPALVSSKLTDLNCVAGVKVDTNGNGFSVDDPQDIVLQPMRTAGTNDTGFYMKVRAYRADAFIQDSSGKLSGIQSGLTLKTGNDETACPNGRQTVTSSGGGKDCPLVTMAADIYLTANTNQLSKIRSRIK